jgi:hypothetical protein
MSAERIYRLLLRAYPPAFRADYEREMMLVFRDQCRDDDVRSVGFWMRVLLDILRSAPALRAEATRTVEVIMKIAAVVAVLLGALGIVGTVRELVAGYQQPVQAGYLLSVVLGVCAFAVIVGAAVAILRGKRQAARPALIAALALMLGARLLFPWMGIFAQLVGFGLPIGLLIALYVPRKPSTLGTA